MHRKMRLIVVIGVAAMALLPAPVTAADTNVPMPGAAQSRNVSNDRYSGAPPDPAWEVYEEPRACSAVKFPRSPLCASGRAKFSPYGIAFPWASF
jgi:hypothetical protein